jgi:hypothetical protein
MTQNTPDPVAARLGFLAATPVRSTVDIARAYVERAESRLAAGQPTGRAGAARQARNALDTLAKSRDYRAPQLRERAQAVLDAVAAL